MQVPVNPPILPMLSKRIAALPEGEGWIFEPKWDGFRALIFRDHDELTRLECAPTIRTASERDSDRRSHETVGASSGPPENGGRGRREAARTQGSRPNPAPLREIRRGHSGTSSQTSAIISSAAATLTCRLARLFCPTHLSRHPKMADSVLGGLQPGPQAIQLVWTSMEVIFLCRALAHAGVKATFPRTLQDISVLAMIVTCWFDHSRRGISAAAS